MVKRTGILFDMHNKHIKGTDPKSMVVNTTVVICNLTNIVSKAIAVDNPKVYVTTRALKHLYDGKVAEEYHFILTNAHTIIKYPDNIYKNKNPKRGDFCFTKELKGSRYICSLERGEGDELCVVTMFRMRKPGYIKSYELLWSWRDDTPSS